MRQKHDAGLRDGHRYRHRDGLDCPGRRHGYGGGGHRFDADCERGGERYGQRRGGHARDSAGNATVAQSGTWPTGIALNTTTGAITTTAAVAPGTYSVIYQLCDKNTTPDCATVTDTVTVTASIVPVADTGTAVAGTASTPIANVAANDTVNGRSRYSGPRATQPSRRVGTWPTGIALNTTTGAITTTAAVAPGTYSVIYQLCDKNTTPDCATVTDTVTVTASIIPVADSRHRGRRHGQHTDRERRGERYGQWRGGHARDRRQRNRCAGGAWPTGIALNTTTGAITTTAAVAPGTYRHLSALR